jgi:hypothetical protein
LVEFIYQAINMIFAWFAIVGSSSHLLVSPNKLPDDTCRATSSWFSISLQLRFLTAPSNLRLDRSSLSSSNGCILQPW